jgi:hypothetical protein
MVEFSSSEPSRASCNSDQADKILKLMGQALHMPRSKTNYLSRARETFLENLPFGTPIEAVDSGVRSIQEWCDCLNETRAKYGLPHDPVSGELESVSSDSSVAQA